MPKKVCILIIFFLQLAGWAHGYEVVALLSSSAEPYALAAETFRNHFQHDSPARGPKAIQPYGITIITLAPREEPDRVSRTIAAARPDLIVAFGSQALRAGVAFKDIPVIYLLVPNPAAIIQEKRNVTGVLLQPLPGLEFHALATTAPQLRRIGVIYDPDRSADLVQATVKNSAQQFLLRPVHHPRDVAAQLTGLAGRIDLLWMLPDSTALSPLTETSYYRFSIQHRIPLLAFSEKYLQKGASFAVQLDLSTMGRLAADLARRVKNGERAEDIHPIQPHGIQLALNPIILDKLGIQTRETHP